MGLVANRMRFYCIRGFQLGLFVTGADRMRSHGTGGKQNKILRNQRLPVRALWNGGCQNKFS
jgi:hypothetical protein